MIATYLIKPKISLFFLITLFMLTCGTSAQAFNVTANSCSASDIQSALDNAISAGGGTVNIPACQADNTWIKGDYIAVTTDVEIRLLGAGKDKTVIGYQDEANPSTGMYFGGSGLVELSDFTFRGSDTAKIATGIKI